jgi:hypothetical protein
MMHAAVHTEGLRVDYGTTTALAGPGEPVVVLARGQGSGDAAEVRAAYGSLFWREVVVGDHVVDADASAGSENSMHLGEYGGPVG